jgi:tetratricopeptide (TPR) repeat protein
LGLLEDAARELEAVARLTPEDTRIQTQLAVVLADLAAKGKRGAEREALERVDLALRLNPDEPEALLLAARLQEARGDWRAAADTLRRAAGVGSLGVDRRAALSLMALAATLAQRGQWLDAASLWEKAVAADPEATREPLMAILREHQRTLLSRPRWSWLVYPQTSPFERKVRYAAAIAFSALAALAAFVLLSGNDATLALSLVPCLLVVVAPVAIVLQGRRRLRERSVPQAEVARAIRSDPASFFRGRPDTTTLLAAAEYVAVELQGAAIAGAHPWVSGRTSPSSRRAWRAASVRAPWLPDGDGDRR